MEFRLKYEGPLKANGDRQHKHELRKAFHPQLKELWNQLPLKSLRQFLDPDQEPSVIKEVGKFQFANLVSTQLDLIAETDIILMRPEEPGAIITSGDIDNRLKTLFDALRYPREPQEIPDDIEPAEDQIPFFCLLEDDKLITSVKVTCDRLLQYEHTSDVFLLIYVRTKPAGGRTWAHLAII